MKNCARLQVLTIEILFSKHLPTATTEMSNLVLDGLFSACFSFQPLFDHLWSTSEKHFVEGTGIGDLIPTIK